MADSAVPLSKADRPIFHDKGVNQVREDCELFCLNACNYFECM